ncbi:unnamed protein product [Linum tenue]|uniref:Uncharacterized protein n=1 Tax=Linum tenue TaxID=586396 RepID=A0AAV0RMU0_9ROSI|nr:unnamed protein product [Linum tenue]
MTTSTKILGPPSVAGVAVSGDKPQTTVTVPSPQTSIEPLIVKSQTLGLTDDPPMGLSEQGSATYLSSGNPCLDFFFHIVPSTPADKLADRLNLAWARSSHRAQAYLQSSRGARAIAEFGYFKDFVEILYRILEGLDVRKKAELERREERAARVMAKRMRRYAHMYRHDENDENSEAGEEPEDEEAGVGITQKAKNSKKSVEASATAKPIDKETARAMRKEREAAKAAKALNRYNSDSNYRLLFDSIADLLKSDIEALKPKDYSRITLAAKWCPSIDSSYDKSLLICEAIARRIFPKKSEKEYESMEESHYAYRVRDRLRKEILVPLRKPLQIPEVYMSAREWNSLPYGRVPSVAMKNYKELFVKHDKERFEEYLEKVKTGKAKIAAGALLPHEIIAQLNDSDGGAVAELQWARVVEDMKKQGKLSNCIAVCDVSGSMDGTPMEVCVALGLLVSELSEEPWKGKVITFSEDPEMHLVEGETLKEKTDFIRRMDWGGSTNFYKVFDKMLDTAVSNNLREDQLVKRVFVFSDMEFKEAYEEPYSYPQHHYYGGSDDDDNDYDYDYDDDENENENEEEEEEKEVAEEAKAENRSWETDYQAIQKKFGEKGYNRVPEIVFWNLRDSSATPVVGTQNGVALVSGFSKNFLTMFMDGDGIVNPEGVMALAIAGEEYKKLVVFD